MKRTKGLIMKTCYDLFYYKLVYLHQQVIFNQKHQFSLWLLKKRKNPENNPVTSDLYQRTSQEYEFSVETGFLWLLMTN
jgi:hypothetical protein